MTQEKPFLFIILGPTASGKEQTALACARLLSAEIISVDSMKIYKKLDTGTAKAGEKEQLEIPHHCLDLAEITENFSTARYLEAAEQAITDIAQKNKAIILSGGTALYYKAILEGLFAGPAADLALRAELEERIANEGLEKLYQELSEADPLAAGKINPADQRRLIRALEIIALTGKPISSQQTQWSGFYKAEEKTFNYRYPCALVRLEWPRWLLRERIDRRVDRLLEKNLLQEAEWLFSQRATAARTPLQAVGYKEFFPYFQGEEKLETAVERLKLNTKHLAKSQETWFRKFPCIVIQPAPDEEQEHLAERVIAAWKAFVLK